jgi:hypothetical protein
LPYTTFEVMVSTLWVWRRVAVGGVFSYLPHEAGDDLRRDLIDPVVVVAELRRRLVPFVLIVDDQPGRRIAGDTDLSVLDRAEAVGHHRKAGDAECHGPENVAIVESHLQPFVEILVVHVVNAVHRVHVSTRQPLHCCIELGHHVIVVKEVARDRQRLRARSDRPILHRGHH